MSEFKNHSNYRHWDQAAFSGWIYTGAKNATVTGAWPKFDTYFLNSIYTAVKTSDLIRRAENHFLAKQILAIYQRPWAWEGGIVARSFKTVAQQPAGARQSSVSKHSPWSDLPSGNTPYREVKWLSFNLLSWILSSAVTVERVGCMQAADPRRQICPLMSRRGGQHQNEAPTADEPPPKSIFMS